MRLGLLGLVVAGLMLVAGGPVLAASQQAVSVKGITLSPAIINVDLDKNLVSTSFKISVGNDSDKPAELSLSSLDFKSLNQSGGVAFVGAGNRYGLANWLSFPQKSITLKPHSSQAVTIKVNNRADLSPGGHYAAILFKDTAGGTGSNHVSFNQAAAVLVFLRKSGGEIYALSLKHPDFGSSLLKLPADLSLPIANTGNTQTVPRGTVTLSDPFGREVKRGIINADSALVLPGSTRLITSNLFNEKTAWLPGIYKLTVTYYSADDGASSQVATYRLFYADLPVLITALLVVLVVVMYFRNYRSLAKPKPKNKKQA